MATGPTRTDLAGGGARGGGDRRDERLAELVAELTSCDHDAAREALRSGAEASDPLEEVARAMTAVRRRVLEPQDRLRVAGFLRPAARLPRRARGATALAEPPADTDNGLVHHGSLRRWERTGEADGEPALDEAVDPDDQVIDLRDRTARFRRPDHRH